MALERDAAVFSSKLSPAERVGLAVRRVVKIVAVLLPLLIAGLSLRDLTLESVVEVLTKSNEVIWRVAIILYFVSLVLGANSDIDDQVKVFRVAAVDSKLPVPAYLLIGGLALAGAVLAYSQTFETFAVALAVFWTIFAIGWKYMVSAITNPMIAAARDVYSARNDYAGLEKTLVVEDFITGTWQISRYAAGGLFALVMLGLAAARYTNAAPLTVLGNINWDSVKSLGMLVFVVAMEAWIWAKRIKMKALLMGLDRLSDRYKFIPSAAS